MKLHAKEILKTKTVGVVCHDAGGAEMVSEWLLQESIPFCACLAGPAEDIFQKKFTQYNKTNFDELFSQSDWILCGSSWQSDIEKKAVKRSHDLGFFVAVCLDHWVNYEDRFLSDRTLTLPSEIWVSDEYAFKLVTNLFPNTPIKVIDNPYLRRIKTELDTARESEFSSDIDILYVCEPIKEHSKIKYGDENFLGYTEETALHFFFDNIHLISSGYTRVVIRPHPSEPANKYDWAKSKNSASLDICIGGDQPLLSEIMRSKIVVGCESMAMVVALTAGRKVYSSIPNKGRDCVLPHEGILMMKDISLENGQKNA